MLLRGVNLGRTNRVSMPDLREALEVAGFEDVRTHLQSGNVVLSSGLPPTRLAERCKSVIGKTFGLDLEVLVRTQKELEAVVRRNPLGAVATEPKRYQVTFLATEPAASVVERLAALATERERFAAHGRELYAWHPDGVARSKLAARLAGDLGVPATARNWTTVAKLLELAGG